MPQTNNLENMLFENLEYVNYTKYEFSVTHYLELHNITGIYFIVNLIFTNIGWIGCLFIIECLHFYLVEDYIKSKKM